MGGMNRAHGDAAESSKKLGLESRTRTRKRVYPKAVKSEGRDLGKSGEARTPAEDPSNQDRPTLPPLLRSCSLETFSR